MTIEVDGLPFSERREQPRYKAKVDAWIKMKSSDGKSKYLKFKTSNLGKSGCMIELGGLPQQLRWKAGTTTKLDMILYIPLSDGKVIRLYHMNAYIRHIQPNGNVGFMLKRKEPNGF